MKRSAAAAAFLGLGLFAAQAQSMAPTPPPSIMPTLGPAVPGLGLVDPQAAMRRAPTFRATAATGQPPPPPSSGAQFHFRLGTMELDIRCGAADTVKDCAEAAAGLMDRFGAAAADPAMPPPTPADAPPPEPGSTAGEPASTQ